MEESNVLDIVNSDGESGDMSNENNRRWAVSQNSKKRKNKVSDSSDISSPKEPPISLSAMYKQLSSHNTSKASKFYKSTIFFYVTNTDIKCK